MDLLQQSGSVGFDDPLGMLKACHEKIRSHCQLLIDLCEYMKTHDADRDAIATGRKILKYFSTAAKNHHQDEELDIFPLIRHSQTVHDLITQLEQDHQKLEKLWLLFEPILEKDNLKKISLLETEIKAFKQHYEEHIQTENNQLIPEAALLLSADQLIKIGKKMRARRAVN